MLVKFHDASKDGDEYIDRGPIWINTDRILAVYDHTVLLDEHKISVMETAIEAVRKLTREREVL